MSFLVSASLEEYHRTEKLESGPEAAQKLQVHEILTKYKWRTVDIQNDKRHMEIWSEEKTCHKLPQVYTLLKCRENEGK